MNDKNTGGTLMSRVVKVPIGNRSVNESLDLFKRMRSGEFENE